MCRDSDVLGKVFNPFNDTENDCPIMLNQFQKIKDACNFHKIEDIQNLLPSQSETVNIFHLNVRSIINKRDDLLGFMHESNTKWDIIAISETWLNKSIENLYNLHNFTSFFCSRENRVGGGAGLYINTRLNPLKIEVPTFTTADVICAEIYFANKPNLIICQIYRPPNTDKNTFIVELERLLMYFHKMNKIICITGDFNIDLFTTASDCHALDFFTTFSSYGFLPTISRATRCTNTSSSLIDNVFCNRLENIYSSGIILHDMTDHFPIFSSLLCDSQLHVAPSMSPLVFDYRHLEDLKLFLIERLRPIENESNPDVIANLITASYMEGISRYSYRRSTSRKTCPRHPWLTPALLISISHKNKLFVKKTKHPSPENINTYKEYRNILTRLLRCAKSKYYHDEFKKYSGNTKETWKALAKLMNTNIQKDSITNKLKNDNGDTLINDKDIAESFNHYFSNIGEKLKSQINPPGDDPANLIDDLPADRNMTLSLTTENELKDIIQGLKNTGAGIDNINAKIFKATFTCIIHYLLILFNMCLTKAIFPAAFKIAVIKPILKSGDAQIKNNYRPISILPLLSKILEKLIYSRLVKHLKENDIIHINQYGFQKNKGTHMPLLILQDLVTKSFECGDFVVGLFLDLRKAFDTVDIDVLLRKVKKYGIREHSFNIISSYLSNRKQCVKIRDTTSSFRNVSIGVPQGSILGPILFLLYINDLPKISTKVTCLSYADDTTIIFRHKNAMELQKIISEVLFLLDSWFKNNFLSLNVSKTFSQHYSLFPSPIRFSISIDGKNVEEKDEVKYLGVIIDKNLKFSAHISHLAKVVARNIGIIGRNRFFLDNHTTLLLYNSLILPHINYCCLIWGINYNSQISKLVILQKRAVRLIDRVYPPVSAEPIFRKYNLLKLEDIAKSQMLLFVHKFFKNQLPTSFDLFFKKKNTQSQRTRRIELIEVPFSNRNYRLFTTPYLGPKLWNDMFHEEFQSIDDIPSSKLIIKRKIRTSLLNTYRSS